jgi:uncharacterized membrane protein YqjE
MSALTISLIIFGLLSLVMLCTTVFFAIKAQKHDEDWYVVCAFVMFIVFCMTIGRMWYLTDLLIEDANDQEKTVQVESTST